MLEIDKIIGQTGFNELTVAKLSKTESCEILLISLEKGHKFPEHTSPRDTTLIMLQGAILFNIQNEEYPLQNQDTFKFQANARHSVIAKEDSKFLIVR